MWKLFSKKPALWAAVIQAVVALVAVYVKDLPQEAILALITAVTGLGFAAQRVEDAKTENAFWSIPFDPYKGEDDEDDI